MYAAEIRKRALTHDADPVVVEDVVTAGAFGILDYLPQDVADELVERFLGLRGFRAPVHFWPSRETCLPNADRVSGSTEPDVVLRGDGWVVVVEAKCRAGFGRHQLAREFDFLAQEIAEHAASVGYLVPLTEDSVETVDASWSVPRRVDASVTRYEPQNETRRFPVESVYAPRPLSATCHPSLAG